MISRRRTTWAERGAVGCSKCRFIGCRSCYVEQEEDNHEEEVEVPIAHAHGGEDKEQNGVEEVETETENEEEVMVPKAAVVAVNPRLLVRGSYVGSAVKKVNEDEGPSAGALIGIFPHHRILNNDDLLFPFLPVRRSLMAQMSDRRTAASVEEEQAEDEEELLEDGADESSMTRLVIPEVGTRFAAPKEVDQNDEEQVVEDGDTFNDDDYDDASVVSMNGTSRFKKNDRGGYIVREGKGSKDKDMFLVNCLLDIRERYPTKKSKINKKGRFEFLVHWEGGDGDDYKSWEPLENLNTTGPLQQEINSLMARHVSRQDEDEADDDEVNNNKNDDDDDDASVVSIKSISRFKKNDWGGYIAQESKGSNDQDMHLVNCLLDIRERYSSKKNKQRRLEFLVHWEGGDGDDFKSWEPLENLNTTGALQPEIDYLIAKHLSRPVDAEADDDDSNSISTDTDDSLDSADKKPAARKKQSRKQLQPSGGNKRRKQQALPSSKRKTVQRTTNLASKESKKRQPGQGVSFDTISPMQVVDGTSLKNNSGIKKNVVAVSSELLDILRGDIPCCLAARIFGRRLRKSKEVALSARLPASFNMDGMKLALLCVKECNAKGGLIHQSKQKMQSAYYVVEGGGDFSTISLQKELEKLANFAAIASPNKCAARLELLFTEAGRLATGASPKLYRVIENLSPDDFEEIDEDCHIGCGFIPRRMLQDFLGSGKVGLTSTSIQVRILVPRLGLFKGLLHAKNGIDKIQLPSSMRKVGPSVHRDHWDKACLLIRTVFPSQQNRHIAKMLGGQKLSKSATTDLCEKRLSDMFTSVLQEAGVTKQVIDEYRTRIWHDPRATAHANLIGLCDPTRNKAIPAGHVFVTGVTNINVTTVVVSRFPCTSKFDQRTLPVVTTKPSAMHMDDWTELLGRSFGEIIFGNPKAGFVPIPETIADGDLDGDLYIITWHKPFLDQAFKHSSDRRSTAATIAAGVVENEDWLERSQAFMRNTEFHRDYGCLRGVLHNRWATLVEGGGGEAEAFGQAYKQALEIKKHGGMVYLPGHLWPQLKPALHRFLTSSSTTTNT